VAEGGGTGWAAQKGKWAEIEKIRPRRKEILFLFFYFLFPNQFKFKCSFKLQIHLECTVQKLLHEYNLFNLFIYYTIETNAFK
jgi:hypothetical protein